MLSAPTPPCRGPLKSRQHGSRCSARHMTSLLNPDIRVTWYVASSTNAGSGRQDVPVWAARQATPVPTPLRPAHGVITCRGSISRNRRASCIRRAGPHQLDGPVSGACPPAGLGVGLEYGRVPVDVSPEQHVRQAVDRILAAQQPRGTSSPQVACYHPQRGRVGCCPRRVRVARKTRRDARG